MISLESGREFLYGYRPHEVGLTGLPKAKKSLKIGTSRISKTEYEATRTVLSGDLPLCFTGATPPRPCPSHPPSLVGGVIKRFGYQPPKVNREMKRRLKRFTTLWCKRNLQKLTDADIPTFEEWLDATPYSKTRKDELLRVWDNAGRVPNIKKFSNIKSFIKDETYPEYKFPRLINSRIDAAKCYFGPIVQAISDRVFTHPMFIKKHPVAERPMVLRDALFEEGAQYIFTDYTAFEAHFTAEVMEMIQFELFKYMLSDTNQKDWLSNYMKVMSGRNILQFKFVNVIIEACRMSGEMDTSLSNGFCNLILFLFLAHENGATNVAGFVEGDDGLFRVTPRSCAPTAKQFADLGFTIKIGVTENLSEASFCGQVYDMTDLIVVTDPMEVLCRVGWTNKRYVNANYSTRMQLLRARGFSLVYQYNGCPMLCALGKRILELTSDVHIEDRIIRNMDFWEKERYLEAMRGLKNWAEKDIGSNTRDLVYKLYGIHPTKQIACEKSFSELSLGKHSVPFLDLVPEVWKDYYNTYSLNYKAEDPTWLLKPEREYLEILKSYECCTRFVVSLRAG